jgi:hypothetical protein
MFKNFYNIRLENNFLIKMDDNQDAGFIAEYAKSDRAGCKLCKLNISKDSLRMAILVQVCFS